MEIDTLCHFHNFKAANPPATVSAAFPRLRTDMGEGRVQKSLGRRKVKPINVKIRLKKFLTFIPRRAIYVVAGKFGVTLLFPNAPPASYTAHHAHGLQDFM